MTDAPPGASTQPPRTQVLFGSRCVEDASERKEAKAPNAKAALSHPRHPNRSARTNPAVFERSEVLPSLFSKAAFFAPYRPKSHWPLLEGRTALRTHFPADHLRDTGEGQVTG
jgi:hypothetical protein